MKNKKRRTAGFSLAEMLLTVLLMGIVLSGLTAAIASAVNVYNKARIRAEAEVLLSTASDAVMTDLALASKITPMSGTDRTNVSFYSPNRGYQMKYDLVAKSDTNDKEYIQILKVKGNGVTETSGNRLLTEGAQPFGIYPVLSPIADVGDGTLKFTLGINNRNGDTIIEPVTYFVRPVTNTQA